MFKHRTSRLFFLAFALLLIGVSLACFLWVRKEQRQYALNRQLIEALKKTDGKQVLALVNAGAGPNTRYDPPALPWTELMNYWQHRSPPPLTTAPPPSSLPVPLLFNNNPTAFLMTCGAWLDDYICLSESERSLLVQAMLVHGAHPNAQDGDGLTALHWTIMLHPRKGLVQQLLIAGVDPNSADVHGETPIILAKTLNHPDLVALLRQYSKHH